MPDFDTDLEALLESLTAPALVCFAARSCERHFDTYEAYLLLEGWGSVAPLRQAVEFVWECLRSGQFSAPPPALLQACRECVPESDSDPMDSVLAMPAYYVAQAVVALLETAEEGTVAAVAEIGEMLRDSVLYYVRAVNQDYRADSSLDGFAFDTLMEEAPLMQEERRIQLADAVFLQTWEAPLADARQDQSDPYDTGGIRPFERGLVPAVLRQRRL